MNLAAPLHLSSVFRRHTGVAQSLEDSALSPSTADYVEKLHQRIAEVEDHFARFFSPIIIRALRGRIRSPELIEDICQETLLRVLIAVRSSAHKLKNPERFGAYVMGVCNNVRREFTRADMRYRLSEDDHSRIPDERLGPEALAVREELRGGVRRVLGCIPKKDQRALSLTFLEERSRSEICSQLGVEEAYFRVLLCRAKSRFRRRYPVHVGLRARMAA
jgi:RNA polymerase sigma factor (sigma-70 family)